MVSDEERTKQTKAKRKSGKVVKLSQAVAAFLRRRGAKDESYDAILRRQFGIPDRKGTAQPLAIYYVVPGSPPLISDDLADARGKAIVQATRKGLKKAVAVLTVREVP